MIKKLTIGNYALIDQLEITFNEGFSVITGETGAGKSIILGALSMILGQRAETKAIKQQDKKCVIEGEFDISLYPLAPLFEEHELEYDAHHTILRREIHPSGKSRAFINDTPVSLALLKELGGALIDIHSQHQNLLLGSERYQLQVVDAIAASATQLASYRTTFRHYTSALKELQQLRKEAQDSLNEEEFLRYQLHELTQLELREGEQAELEQEQEILSHADEIKGELYAATQLLYGAEAAVVSTLGSALARLQSIKELHPEVEELHQRMHSNYIDLKDIAAEVESAEERIAVNPQRLQQVEERLNAIYRLQQKHHLSSVEQLLALQESLTQRIDRIDHSGEAIEALEIEVEKSLERATQEASILTQLRSEAAKRLAVELAERVKPLGMPNLRFEVELLPKKALDSMGAEEIAFLFSANKNQLLQPVAEVASGGEISRLMLCIKSLISGAVALPTIIFDEIDTGVSGDIADKMAGIMQEMAHHMQVMSITHLPQVAAKGSTHYKVYKHDVEERTQTEIVLLSPTEREEEIARMLSGSELTQAAMDNARALLQAN